MKETISREEFNKMDKDLLYTLFTGMQEQLERSNETIDALRATVEKLNEQIRIMNTKLFGKSSEKSLAPSDQISIYEFGFNEAEFLAQGKAIEEPEIEEVVIHRKKSKGKRDEDLSGFEAIPVEHGLSEEELAERFPEGYYELDDEVYRKLEVEPAVFKVIEHHIKVYKGKNGTIVKGKHPKEMLNNSIATPSLAAFIMNAKYVNAVPLDNNIAEQAIRPFCVGRNNWKLIDTIGGANASAIIYSIVETAKANDINIYKYLKYLLTEIPQHMDETSTDFMEDLMPWSRSLPPECRKKKASN